MVRSLVFNIVKEMLGSLGYTVVTKTNSLEALALFQEGPNSFDLVITDINMPNLTGEKLALKLMETRNNIPIIFCTGDSEFILIEALADIEGRHELNTRSCGSV